MSEDRLKYLADLDFYRSQALFMASTPIGEVLETRDLFLVNSGAPFAQFNLATWPRDGAMPSYASASKVGDVTIEGEGAGAHELNVIGPLHDELRHFRWGLDPF